MKEKLSMTESEEGYKTDSSKEVISAESDHLKLKTGDPVSGIALSGGGIRSASFGLGVMQALVANDQLHKMDYMSTVSGGGYLGAALTWALKQGEGAFGTHSDNFPLGKKKEEGNKNNIENNGLLNFIRQHSSYLMPTGKLDMVSFAAVVLRSMIISLFFYLSVLTIAMTFCVWCLYGIAHESLNGLNHTLIQRFNLESHNFNKGLLISMAALIFVGVIILAFSYSLRTFSKTTSTKRYLKFITGQQVLGIMLKVSFACVIFGSLPYVADALDEYVTPTAGGSSLFGATVGVWQYVKARKNKKGNTRISNTMIYAGAFALIYGIFLFAYVITTKVFLNEGLGFKHLWLFFILIGITASVGYFVNLNLIGPNYIWRIRLMETFMPSKEAVRDNSWKPAVDADIALMKDMCMGQIRRPYHIINTNVILTNSQKVNYRGRGGDNFIISPLFCGSDATGWQTTFSFQKNTGRGITLAGAISASAAALNPNAGVSGGGVTRNKTISILLSLLNLRLGFWINNPQKDNPKARSNFFVPGLTSEILKYGLNETSDDLLLSDGGHFENLAFYELIRRKLNLIVVSDGACDGSFNFDDLANAIEKVRVDFGARINFMDKYMSDEILPGTGGETYFQKKYQISKKGFAIADIDYHDGKKGVLVYIKLAVIDRLSTDVYSYKGINPTFPHQSTSDQFFDEKQFEAYRELGYSVCKQAILSEEGKKIFKLKTDEMLGVA